MDQLYEVAHYLKLLGNKTHLTMLVLLKDHCILHNDTLKC